MKVKNNDLSAPTKMRPLHYFISHMYSVSLIFAGMEEVIKVVLNREE